QFYTLSLHDALPISNLHAQTRLALRLSSQGTASRTSVGAAIYFARQTELSVEADNTRNAISQDIVLTKQGGRRRKNSNAQITEGDRKSTRLNSSHVA